MFFIISALSGTGKTTIIEALMKRNSQLKMSISATTRPARNCEIHGTHYHFLSQESFDEKLEAGEFFETKEVFGNKYGTLHEEFKCDIDKIFDVDVCGLEKIKRVYPTTTAIGILPPSLSTLEHRLQIRGEKEIRLRMNNAEGELKRLVNCCDHLVVNYDLEETVSNIERIITIYK